ncbi:uncharacterized protein F5147DRAFT_746825 [Suillus discolor]|uniref:GATA-type domain-containing protein n=1 Tax=Suillus discolor TaxID=1912936 RepID=A0A9P7F197_9AGAM|nr:uncharacterized protein F5147DRAFT_746825 [Suillus discolor]KAG2102571.1 hypothetical protein F5147DRAFT_746825 [Suillus discolor]
MPHRVDSMPMPSSHRRDYDYDYDHSYRRPSPPPIATLSHSPSLSVSSLDRSSVSSPAPRRSPTDRSVDSHSTYSDAYYSQDQMARQSRPYPHDPVRDSGRVSHSYSYTPRPHPEHRYSHDSHPYHVSSSYSSPALAHSAASSGRDSSQLPYTLPGQSYHAIGYTDDAATKLSDRVRRRCFNCCTTDTSTWRRSNLNPGKVLCNKCGLFERTHGRSRPDQFPHRRGALATTAMRPRTPPQTTHLPPISTHVPPLAPYHFSHPSIAPLQSVPDSRRSQHPNTLPEIQSWIDAPAGRTSYSAPSSADRGHESGRQRSPPRLHHVDMRSSSVHEAVA